jgi:hypothetical protein
VKRGILVPKNARCCSSHTYKRQLTYEALEIIEPSKIDNLILNGDDVKNLLIDFRLTINTTKSFDFDNPSSLDDDGYNTITGFSRGASVFFSNFGNSIFVLSKIIFTTYLII